MKETKSLLEPLPRMLFTLHEAAAILGVNINTIHELRKAGLIKCMKLGRYKIRRENLEEFLITYDGQDVLSLLDSKQETRGIER